MERILIIGRNSYLAINFERWLNQWPKKYKIEKISVRTKDWKTQNWSDFDVVINFAAIVHNSTESNNTKLFNAINRDLAFEIAKKAKKDGVNQYIFMSTMSVYGINKGSITQKTLVNPHESYGRSKLEGERMISTLIDENFFVAIIRPPMVYGPGAPGNYQRLSTLAKVTPIFPKFNNKRSMIYIDNLSNYIVKVIEKKVNGIHYPQNENYVNVQDMVKEIANNHNKKIYFTDIFNKILLSLEKNSIQKVMGDLYYDMELSNSLIDNYTVINFKDSIYKSELKIKEIQRE